MAETGKLHLACCAAMHDRLLVWNNEQGFYECPARAPNCRFVEYHWGELRRYGDDCGAFPRLVTVDVFLVPEGAKPNPPLFWSVLASDAVELLGLSKRLPYGARLPSFNAGQSARLDGFRGSRVAVARVDAMAAKILKLKEGYYFLRRTVDEVKALKVSQTERVA
jgi:hypothetical protein